MTESDKWHTLAWAVLAIVVGWAALRMLRPQEPTPAPVRVERAGARDAGGGGRSGLGSERSGLYVHVAGAVRRPGLLRVADGSRLAVAIARAGGPTRGADLSGVNLAQPLEDGQQVIVPVRAGRGAAGGPPRSTGAPAPAGAPAALSLATATLEELDALDGIGPTIAKRIVEYRQAHGGFRSLDELQEVDGIGEKRFATLRKLLRP